MGNKTFKKNSKNEKVNGQTTSNSYNTYSSLDKNNKRIHTHTLFSIISVSILLIASIFVFASTIKTAYFNNRSNDEPTKSNLPKTVSKSDKTDILELENVTEDISKIFDIPVGVKIKKINTSSHLSSGLKINDIIVKIAGITISSIDDFNTAVESFEDDITFNYTVYRNGAYKTVDPNTPDE